MIRALRRGAIFAAVLLALPTPSFAARRQLLSVDLHVEGDAPWLSITTDGPPNFTSFKLNHPTRVVVDFPETSGAATKETGPAEGVVAGWTIEPLGSDDRVVTRLTVELRSDADYRLISNGSVVELRLQRATARPLVALESDHAGPAQPAAELPDAGTLLLAPEPPAAQPPPPPPMTAAEKARLARAHQLELQREAQELAVAKKKKAADERKAREAAIREAARVKQQAKLKAQREALALAAEKKRKAAEAARVKQEAKLKAQREAVAAVRAKQEAKLRAQREALAASRARAAEKLKQQREAAADTRARRDEQQRARVAAAAEQARIARAHRAAVAAAKAEKVREQREEAARIKALRPATLGQIGFRRVGHDAEITLHTSVPVTYAMHEAAPDRLLLSLDKTRITVQNNRRPLDTRWFGTPVAHIVPREDLKSVRVDIEFDLATPAAPYEIKPGPHSTLTVVFHTLMPARAEVQGSTGLTSAP